MTISYKPGDKVVLISTTCKKVCNVYKILPSGNVKLDNCDIVDIKTGNIKGSFDGFTFTRVEPYTDEWKTYFIKVNLKRYIEAAMYKLDINNMTVEQLERLKTDLEAIQQKDN